MLTQTKELDSAGKRLTQLETSSGAIPLIKWSDNTNGSAGDYFRENISMVGALVEPDPCQERLNAQIKTERAIIALLKQNLDLELESLALAETLHSIDKHMNSISYGRLERDMNDDEEQWNVSDNVTSDGMKLESRMDSIRRSGYDDRTQGGSSVEDRLTNHLEIPELVEGWIDWVRVESAAFTHTLEHMLKRQEGHLLGLENTRNGNGCGGLLSMETISWYPWKFKKHKNTEVLPSKAHVITGHVLSSRDSHVNWNSNVDTGLGLDPSVNNGNISDGRHGMGTGRGKRQVIEYFLNDFQDVLVKRDTRAQLGKNRDSEIHKIGLKHLNVGQRDNGHLDRYQASEDHDGLDHVNVGSRENDGLDPLPPRGGQHGLDHVNVGSMGNGQLDPLQPRGGQIGLDLVAPRENGQLDSLRPRGEGDGYRGFVGHRRSPARMSVRQGNPGESNARTENDSSWSDAENGNVSSWSETQNETNRYDTNTKDSLSSTPGTAEGISSVGIRKVNIDGGGRVKRHATYDMTADDEIESDEQKRDAAADEDFYVEEDEDNLEESDVETGEDDVTLKNSKLGQKTKDKREDSVQEKRSPYGSGQIIVVPKPKRGNEVKDEKRSDNIDREMNDEERASELDQDVKSKRQYFGTKQKKTARIVVAENRKNPERVDQDRSHLLNVQSQREIEQKILMHQRRQQMEQKKQYEIQQQLLKKHHKEQMNLINALDKKAQMEKAKQAALKKAAEEAKQQAALKKAKEEAKQQAALKKAKEEAKQQAALKKAKEEAKQQAALKKAKEEAKQQAALKKAKEEAKQQAALKKAKEETKQQAALKKAKEEAKQQAALKKANEARLVKTATVQEKPKEDPHLKMIQGLQQQLRDQQIQQLLQQQTLRQQEQQQKQHHEKQQKLLEQMQKQLADQQKQHQTLQQTREQKEAEMFRLHKKEQKLLEQLQNQLLQQQEQQRLQKQKEERQRQQELLRLQKQEEERQRQQQQQQLRQNSTRKQAVNKTLEQEKLQQQLKQQLQDLQSQQRLQQLMQEQQLQQLQQQLKDHQKQQQTLQQSREQKDAEMLQLHKKEQKLLEQLQKQLLQQQEQQRLQKQKEEKQRQQEQQRLQKEQQEELKQKKLQQQLQQREKAQQQQTQNTTTKQELKELGTNSNWE